MWRFLVWSCPLCLSLIYITTTSLSIFLHKYCLSKLSICLRRVSVSVCMCVGVIEICRPSVWMLCVCVSIILVYLLCSFLFCGAWCGVVDSYATDCVVVGYVGWTCVWKCKRICSIHVQFAASESSPFCVASFLLSVSERLNFYDFEFLSVLPHSLF